MLKYIVDMVIALNGRKNGIATNAAKWAGQPYTELQLETWVDELTAIDQEINTLKDQVKQKLADARAMVALRETDLEGIDSLARGFHITEPTKLEDYDIAPRKDATDQPVPGKVMIQSIVDDSDGEGFVLTIQKLPYTEFYEWEKFIAPDGSPTAPTPPFPFFKTTKKITFIDDDVPPGVRVWYHCRAKNATGAGEWSEPVNRVQ